MRIELRREAVSGSAATAERDPVQLAIFSHRWAYFPTGGRPHPAASSAELGFRCLGNAHNSALTYVRGCCCIQPFASVSNRTSM